VPGINGMQGAQVRRGLTGANDRLSTRPPRVDVKFDKSAHCIQWRLLVNRSADVQPAESIFDVKWKVREERLEERLTMKPGTQRLTLPFSAHVCTPC
jgi:hypothetical protein